MAYVTLVTNVGLAKNSAALAGNTQIIITHMAVGDGDGSVVIPSQTQTALVNETYRAAPNIIGVNDDGDFVIELIVPATEGGFTVREIGIFDADGALIAVANTPEVTKPLESENAAAELVMRLIVASSNASEIAVTVGSGIIATRDWVELNFATGTLLAGGTTGQVLTKNSNIDGDTTWANPTDVSVTVNTLEEEQTLTAGDTVVDLTVVTTAGLAIYADGVRVKKSDWTATTATQVTFDAAFGADVDLLMVQNEPAAQIEAVPVGGVVFLANSALPSAVYGYGTWLQISKGQFIVGLDVADTDFNTLKKTGGSKAVNINGSTATAGSHNHGGATAGHALSLAQMPEHQHSFKDHYGAESPSGSSLATNKEIKFTNNNFGSNASDYDNTTYVYLNEQTALAGGGATHSHNLSADGVHSHSIDITMSSRLPPYCALAVWERTA